MSATKVVKGRDGWVAETRITLNAKQELRIGTFKNSRGVQTSASVVEPTPHGYRCVVFQDFNEVVTNGVGLRCTESTVRSEHSKALQQVDELKTRALAHYEKKQPQTI